MIHIFGHKNPDSDSVCSAIALAHLKNLEGVESKPFVLGNINNETDYILNCFDSEAPELLKEIKIQVSDLKYDKPTPVGPETSILFAYNYMEDNKIRTLPVVDDTNKLIGILTMKDIAMHFIREENLTLDTSASNIINSLDGKFLMPKGIDNNLEDFNIQGKINVISYYYKTLKQKDVINSSSIIIVGDNYEVIQLAIEKNARLIIVTGDPDLPEDVLIKAYEKNILIISVPHNTYKVSRKISLCNYVSTMMFTGDVARFKPHHTLDDVKEDMTMFKYTNYPVLLPGKKYLGMLSRNDIISPTKKKVILVDHNEYTQSVDGLLEAEIVEIIDHHKIGDIYTRAPICFRNMPVGSTCTIIFNLFKEKNIKIDYNIAGLLFSGIISDTMLLKSPTTTDLDEIATKELNEILNLDIDKHAQDMFKAGSSLEGQSVDMIFNKDYKEFEFDSIKIGVSQIFSLDIENVINMQEELLEYINLFHERNNNEVTLFAITDILQEGSFILFRSNNQLLLKKILDDNVEQGAFLEGVVSRKKQLLPKIAEAISAIKNM